MGLVARGPGRHAGRALVAGALVAALAGCGGSVADADSRSAPTTRAAPAQATPFCAAVRADAEALSSLSGLTVRGTVPPDQLATTVDAVRRAGLDLQDTAPTTVRPDVQVTLTALGVELDALVAAGGDASVAARDPAVAARSEAPDVAASGRRVAEYVNANCRPA